MLSFSTLEYLPAKKPRTTLKSEESTFKNTKLNIAIGDRLNLELLN